MTSPDVLIALLNRAGRAQDISDLFDELGLPPPREPPDGSPLDVSSPQRGLHLRIAWFARGKGICEAVLTGVAFEPPAQPPFGLNWRAQTPADAEARFGAPMAHAGRDVTFLLPDDLTLGLRFSRELNRLERITVVRLGSPTL